VTACERIQQLITHCELWPFQRSVGRLDPLRIDCTARRQTGDVFGCQQQRSSQTGRIESWFALKEIFSRLINARFEILMVENPYTQLPNPGCLCPSALLS
jgi:hypothetical protein